MKPQLDLSIPGSSFISNMYGLIALYSSKSSIYEREVLIFIDRDDSIIIRLHVRLVLKQWIFSNENDVCKSSSARGTCLSTEELQRSINQAVSASLHFSALADSLLMIQKLRPCESSSSFVEARTKEDDYLFSKS